ncbi:MAG: hypothetical protein ABEJ26_13020 [Halosimplex sp.]
MPGKASSSALGRDVGVAVAALAVVLLVLDRTTDLAVPYGYDGGGSVVVGAVGALVVVLAVLAWYYRDRTAT